MIPNPKAVVFDLDGTLIDSEPSHKKAEISAFGLMGLTILEADLLPFTGLTLPDMLGRVGAAHGREITIEEFLAVEHSILQGYLDTSITLFEDAVALIAALDVPLAIGTSSMPWYVEAVNTRFPEIGVRFPVQFCSAHVSQGKPHPETFLLAFSALQVSPEDGWVIEDSVNGVRAAKAAGAFTIGIDRYGQGHLGQADLVVSDLRELISAL